MSSVPPKEYAAALRREAREMAARELVARGRRPELYSSAADNAGSEGMVTVWDDDGRYLGCMGVETWERSLTFSDRSRSVDAREVVRKCAEGSTTVNRELPTKPDPALICYRPDSGAPRGLVWLVLASIVIFAVVRIVTA